MDVLIVGGGGREAALAWKLSESELLGEMWVTHQNPGFPDSVRLLPEGETAVEAQKAGIGLVVIGPEAPLAEGLADRCRACGIPVFGPSKAAAQLEASKGFAKDFMARHGIPTAGYSRHQTRDSAHASVDGPCVVKADGLAAGKGVYICEDADQAHSAVDALFDGAHGRAGMEVVLEELLHGEEASVLALCDGERMVVLPAAQDHKRRFDGDQGPNTGGMGAYAPAPVVDEALAERIRQEVLLPTLEGMAQDGHPFVGVLYAGLMMTSRGPMVLEYNGRFGDPECQPLMMLLEEDLLPILLDCAEGRLESRELQIREGAACCVVMVSGGYPGDYPKGLAISGLETHHDDVVIFQAGTRQQSDGTICTNGGRVLGITGRGTDIKQARQRAYAVIESIDFEGAAWREDIAWRALEERR
ncbi:MAG: phosphoribosylamine--glycine ligase [Myxococcota bacterium]|nr:phosphoribosylamine--glycine ligase [Myxococcota bacterium]